jgi:hypothetical protein
MNRTIAARWGWLVPVAALAVGGCAGVAWMVTQFAPPQQVKALYKPPPGKTILVFVDDILNPVPYEPVKGELTDQINEKLLTHKIATMTIPHEAMMQLMSVTKDFDRLSVAEVGQKLKADLVLYVHIDKLSLKEDAQSPLWQGQLQATIRLVDVSAGRLWPQDRPEGHAVPPAQTPPTDNPSSIYGEQVARDLAGQMAEHIVAVFYDHTAAPGEGS